MRLSLTPEQLKYLESLGVLMDGSAAPTAPTGDGSHGAGKVPHAMPPNSPPARPSSGGDVWLLLTVLPAAILVFSLVLFLVAGR